MAWLPSGSLARVKGRAYSPNASAKQKAKRRAKARRARRR